MNDEPVATGEVSPAEAAELIEAGAELIDVRRPYEFEGGRIAGARNVEMNELARHAEELPRDRPVLLYCRSGNRSAMASEALRQAGFDAHHLTGGLEAWIADGRPLNPDGGEVRPPLPAS
jgi:rhodanese-related sulfurtransferase